MQTICCQEFGPPDTLRFVDRNLPPPKPDEVRVRVNAAGVGFVDGLLIQGLYQIKPPLPFYPGSEFAGVVLTVGDAVTNLAPGDRVMGLGNGSFAQELNVRADACTPIPATDSDTAAIEDTDAAGLVINYATALYGLRNCGKLQPGETLLVLGAAGGVGSAAVAVAKTLGATVIAAASSSAKLDLATSIGADHTVNYSAANWRDELKRTLSENSLNLDMVYDPVGGDFAEPALRSLAPGGRFLVVGFASGSIPSVPLNLALLKRCSIVGVDWGGEARANTALTPALLDQLLQWLQQGKLQAPPVTVRKLSDIREVLADQLAGKILGKLVIDCRQ